MATRMFALLLVVVGQPALVSAAVPLNLKNAEFKDWSDGAPAGWAVNVGAQSGSDVLSRVQPLDNGGVELAGDSSTGQWRSLTQRIAVPAKAALRLKFETRTRGLKREPPQFDNCYLGQAVFDAGGKRLSLNVRTLFETVWAPGQLAVILSESAASVEVTLFLSKTGVLQVLSVGLERLSEADSFDVLVEEIDRYYSFLALKGLDWRERSAVYQAAGRSAQSAEQFIAAVQPLLAELKDLHVRLDSSEGKSVPSFTSSSGRNLDAQTIASQLKDVKQVGRMGFVGRTAGGFGYVAVGTLAADQETTTQMLAAFDSLLDAQGLIIDLRVNSGGNERVAQEFTSRLVSEPLIYASNQFRNSAEYDDLITLGTRQVTPRAGRKYRGPVVGLIGPGCASSGEGFALMLQAMGEVRLIGQPTRGASGNPQPVALPNGVTVYYSTWVPLSQGGKPFEGSGIAPAIRIDDDLSGVKGLQAAIAYLAERVK